MTFANWASLLWNGQHRARSLITGRAKPQRHISLVLGIKEKRTWGEKKRLGCNVVTAFIIYPPVPIGEAFYRSVFANTFLMWKYFTVETLNAGEVTHLLLLHSVTQQRWIWDGFFFFFSLIHIQWVLFLKIKNIQRYFTSTWSKLLRRL